MKSEKSLDWWSWNLFPHQVHFLFHFEFEQQWSYSLNPRKICWTRVSSVNINKMTILHQNQSLQNMSHVTWLTCMGDHLVASSSSYFCLSLIELLTNLIGDSTCRTRGCIKLGFRSQISISIDFYPFSMFTVLKIGQRSCETSLRVVKNS